MIDVTLKRDGQTQQSFSFPASETLTIESDKFCIVLYSKDPKMDMQALASLSHSIQGLWSKRNEAITHANIASARAIVATWNAFFARESIDDPEEAWLDVITDFETLATLLQPYGDAQ